MGGLRWFNRIADRITGQIIFHKTSLKSDSHTFFYLVSLSLSLDIFLSSSSWIRMIFGSGR